MTGMASGALMALCFYAGTRRDGERGKNGKGEMVRQPAAQYYLLYRKFELYRGAE